jgi:hypothetical protein
MYFMIEQYVVSNRGCCFISNNVSDVVHPKYLGCSAYKIPRFLTRDSKTGRKLGKPVWIGLSKTDHLN